MSRHEQFETHGPIDLYVEIGGGSIQVTATDTTESTVTIDGTDADEVEVRFDGRELAVVAPQQRGLFSGRDRRLDVTVTLPTGSNLATRTGSADLQTSGELASGRLKSGSGEADLDVFSGSLWVETGSGDIQLGEGRQEVQLKSGSGDVSVGRTGGDCSVSTGSGDVELGTVAGRSVVKTGSGDLSVANAESDVSLRTGSGDLVVRRAARGRVSVKGASGDVVVGIPSGTPVWTDVTTMSGTISSELESLGAPSEGQDHVEIQARTVSGDIQLRHI